MRDNAYMIGMKESNAEIKFTLRSGGGTVDFQEFVGGLSAFSSRGGREEKLKCRSHSLPSVLSGIE